MPILNGMAGDNDEGPEFGPARPPANAQDSDQEEEEDEDMAADDEDPYRVPLSNEISLKGPKKVVSALAVDHSGSRVLSGSHDYNVQMFDFDGMQRDLNT